MGKKRGDKWPTEYLHVVHATELERRKRYHGCVSRQTLRAQLRRDNQKELREEGPRLPHAVVRLHSLKNARADYRRLMTQP